VGLLGGGDKPPFLCIMAVEEEGVDSLAIAALAAGSYTLWLWLERTRIDRARSRIPSRVAVTGTRGKSSVTRLIAAGLRGGGIRVWAKATGSAAELIGPDGREEAVKRRGSSSILEQGRLIRAAAADRAAAIVFEAMSTMPETQRTEGRCILRPTILVITNARLDHLRGAVQSREDMAAMLMLSAVPGTKVFVPEEELLPVMREAARAAGAELLPVARAAPAPGAAAPQPGLAGGTPLSASEAQAVFDGSLGYPEFEVNLRLALAVCAALGVPEESALAGMRTVRPDVGRFRASRFVLASGQRVLAASGFAANDPSSTLAVFAAAEAELGPEGPRIWLFNVRRDRGERSLQWIETLPGLGAACDAVLVIGDGAQGRAVAARLKKRGLRAEFCGSGDAASITGAAARLGEAVLRESRTGGLGAAGGPSAAGPADSAAAKASARTEASAAVPAGQASSAAASSEKASEIFIFGMGNIAGPGKPLVDYWEKEGAK